MKKLLLTGAMLLALSFSSKAQGIITSFESSETPGYTVNTDIADYDTFWSTTKVISTSAGSSTGEVPTGEVVISDTWASNGAQSLYFPGRNVNSENANDVNYAVSTVLNFTTLTAPYSFDFDTYTNVVDGNGANFNAEFYAYDADTQDSAFLGGIIFNYDGDVYAYNTETEEYEVINSFDAETTMSFKIRINADDSITYIMGEDEVLTSAVDSAVLTGYYFGAFGTDDWSSDWYVDNLAVSLPVAAVDNTSLTKLAVFPNPTSDVINVANAGLISNLKVTDLNGRTVKSASFDGVDTANVSIADLTAGVYMMTVTSDKGAKTTKIVKN